MAQRQVLPSLPTAHEHLLSYLEDNIDKKPTELFQPYREYDAKVRELYAQQSEAITSDHINVVSVFDGPTVKTRARMTAQEGETEKECYIMPLLESHRRIEGSPATVDDLKQFKNNFNIFTESSLSDLDWSNVVVAGSAALAPLLPVPGKYKSKRDLRQYYHEELAPASDVDLFLYGLTEEQARDKIKQIEARIRDSILHEVTCIRTKHAITIASQYPTRHIQIVLRIYKSVSEILTGFDVDCSCVAYDGRKVWAAPRALQAMMTQVNHIDLTRRSPSYENRLSKYAKRGFEVYWSELDRTRIDPTIFEQSFMRTVGLARLLVLEKLPGSTERDQYANMRRRERGRPQLNLWRRNLRKLKGDIKQDHEDEVADWLDQDDISDYHTFSIPYGPRFNAKKIEKLLYTKDLLLNAEWNRGKDREVDLHRHPAFFGVADDVFGDCCGTCPVPVSDAEIQTAEEEDRIYVKGQVTFIQDHPGRQQIGSFNPITDSDWTEMAYVGNTARLCAAIVDNDLNNVKAWLAQEDADPNQRDHTGRTPLQLAVLCSTPEIVEALIDANARITARMANGFTALHLAAERGNAEMIRTILQRSERNEAEHEEKEAREKDERTKVRNAETQLSEPSKNADDTGDVSDDNLSDEDWNSDAESISMATESFVKVTGDSLTDKVEALPDDNNDEPDFYNVDITAWDVSCSPLHLAILNGHHEAVKMLVDLFGADVLLPIKLLNDYDKSPRAAILTLVLSLALPQEQARTMAKTLLDLHASSSQADLNGVTVLQYYVNDGVDALSFLLENDRASSVAALHHLTVSSSSWNPETNSALLTAISNSDPITCLKILENGVAPSIHFSSWIKQAKMAFDEHGRSRLNADPEHSTKLFQKSVEQPLIAAIANDVIDVAMALLEAGADPNTLPRASAELLSSSYSYHSGQSALDLVRAKLEKLRKYDGEKDDNEPPLSLKSDGDYLKDIPPGSYKYWVASTSLKYAKERYEKDTESHEKHIKDFQAREGLQEKQDAVRNSLNGFAKLEAELLSRGAKTFKTLHPDVPQSDNGNNYRYRPYKAIKKSFEVSFSFRIGELHEELKQRYLQLFEAAWIGDLDTIKALSLMPDGDQPPLKIATQDESGASPFCIAVMRGHIKVAEAILEICSAQYSPKDKDEKTTRYTMTQQNDEYTDSEIESEADSEDVQLYKHIAGDRFTIDNIGEVSLKVDSHITPLEYLGWSCPTIMFSDGGVVKTSSSSGSVMGYAIDASDQELLTWLIDIGQKYSMTSVGNDDDTPSHFYSLSTSYLQQAIKLGETKIIAELLKRTGCGIPFEDLVKKSGVENHEKPKYYQGLSVYGKKRTDWAAAGRRMQVQTTSGSQISPLLMAATMGTLESLEYFLSDTPLRLYHEFVSANNIDNRVKRLSQTERGVDKAITDWYHANEDCLINFVLVGNPNSDGDARLQYLIKAFPAQIEAKSTAGETPLQLAFKFGRRSMAKLLLEAGANAMTRDKAANNLIHKLLEKFSLRDQDHKLENLKAMLELLDAETCHTLMMQRNCASAGGGSPLHNWLQARMHDIADGTPSDKTAEGIELLLSYSKGDELTLINAAGDTLLHTLIAGRKIRVTKQLLDRSPELIHRENATGRTPFELAHDLYTALKLKNPPTVAGPSSNRFSFGYGNDDVHALSDNDPSTFVKKDGEDQLSVEEKVWMLIKDAAAKDSGKRRLIALNEANLVAARLSDMAQSSKRGNGTRLSINVHHSDEDNGEQANKEVDAVVQWVNDAVPWLKEEENRV